MSLGKNEAGKIYADYTENIKEKIIIGDDGFRDFMFGTGSISVWGEDGIDI